MVVLPWYAVLCCVVAIGLFLFYDILFSTAQGTLSSLFTLCLEITIDVLNCFDWKQVEQPCLISLKTSKPSKVLIPLNLSKTSKTSKLEVFRGFRDFPKYRCLLPLCPWLSDLSKCFSPLSGGPLKSISSFCPTMSTGTTQDFSRGRWWSRGHRWAGWHWCW